MAEVPKHDNYFYQPERIGKTVFSEHGTELVWAWTWHFVGDAESDDAENVFWCWLNEGTLDEPLRDVALVSADGVRLTGKEFHIDDHSDFVNGVAEVEIGGKYGCIDTAGKIVVPPLYDEIYDCHNGFVSAKKNGRWLMVDLEGKEIIPPEKYRKLGVMMSGRCPASTMDLTSDDLAYYSDNACNAGWWGFLDETGREVIAPQYIYATDFVEEGLAVVCKGEWTRSPKWDNAHKKGCFWTEEELWGVIDTEGREVIPCQYDDISIFQFEPLTFHVHSGSWETGKWGVMDERGKWIVPPVFEQCVRECGKDFLVFEEWDEHGERSGVYDLRTQKILFYAEFSFVSLLGNGLFLVEKRDDEGHPIQWMIDRNGREIIPPKYHTIDCSEEPYLVAMMCGNEKLEGLCDPDGTEILPCKYHFDDSHSYENKNIIFVENGKYGVVDFEGNILIPAKYDNLERLTPEWFVYEEKYGFYGILSSSGKIILDAEDSNGCITSDRHGNIIVKGDYVVDVYKVHTVSGKN